MNNDLLYIEDDSTNVALMRRVLRLREKVQLHVATTPAEGVAVAQTCCPALIILDNRLPDGTGSEVVVLLRALPVSAMTPIAILTGDSGRQTADRLLELGATHFLEKPIDIDQLLGIIDRYVPAAQSSVE